MTSRIHPDGFLGVLMLDTRFPRPPGDVGNAQTYARAGIPVRFVTVQGASPRKTWWTPPRAWRLTPQA